ncbi:alpha/beta fold hydrolase [Enterococcus songbeiensis]|uniref:alpha/beta fold hydrolase n=1 Tax=Enterococcus songbeiensis TaxID=2559927 RepID=UPI0010FA40F9|nr:alpha/beta fold hydrolase [Enterococcus songbeiensis]
MQTETLQSADGRHFLHVALWLPQEKPKAVVQIIHGMVEHIIRYEEFALFLVEQGIAVVGHDHLGHGFSSTPEEFGHFGDQKGAEYLVADTAAVYQTYRNRFPEIPYFILGHSMGSLVLRNFLQQYPTAELSGAILMGTNHSSQIKMQAALLLTKVLMVLQGKQHPSQFLDRLAFGGFNRRFRPARTPKDWLSRDTEMVDRYLADEKTQFIFTTQAYHDLFRLTKNAGDPKKIRQGVPDFPVLLISGKEDPVGNFGKGIIALQRLLEKCWQQPIQLHLLPDGRHELLNETNRQEIYQELAEWFAKYGA